jgi:hypothetical protein
MGWSIGWDSNWQRDIGYGVPAYCDHPNCHEHIDRGLSYVCGGEPYGGDEGCGLYFCSQHLFIERGHPQRCERCWDGQMEPFECDSGSSAVDTSQADRRKLGSVARGEP